MRANRQIEADRNLMSKLKVTFLAALATVIIVAGSGSAERREGIEGLERECRGGSRPEYSLVRRSDQGGVFAEV
jgi:hypothetical protein